MEEYRNPIHAAEPFEEARKENASVASPDALAAFYKDMERIEIVERKLSKKSNVGTSIWSRKSVKRSAARPAQVSHQSKQSSGLCDEKREEEEPVSTNHHDTDSPDWVLPMNSPRSVIPDSRDLPASHNKDVWKSVPIPSHRVRYFIHNPVGPRWYKNHHLIPPSETTPAARPPSFFSTSFPPIAASASQDRLEDPTRIAGPSRTPSNSPLPTPNSSQTRVEDRPRTRKLSETAHDAVDLWDVTDPWGTNWHHHSPYDIGLVNGAISADVHDVLQTRSRRSSMDQSRGRTVAPSPLSQSTSAVNLQVKPEIHVPRKLSKRRAATLASANTGSQDTGRHAMSLPTTPLDTRPSSTDLPKRMSVAALPFGSSISTQNISPKKGKRGGVLGRLMRKFSLLTKPLSDPNRATGRDSDWQQINSFNPVPDTALRNSFAPSSQISPEKPVSEAGKRVPPPPPPVEDPMKVDDATKDVDSSSVVSFEAPFSIGRLTIANPDSPGSGDTTPAQVAVPLPPNKEPLENASRHEPASYLTSSTPQIDPNPPVPPEKTPPLPTPPAKLDDEVVSEALPASPVTTRQSSPNFLSQGLESLQRLPSILNHESSVSVQGSELPDPAIKTDQSTFAHPVASQNTSQPVDQPPSQPSQTLQPASSTPKNAIPASVASTVPFPTSNPAERLQPFYEFDNSPLSAASVLANPPTPYRDTDKAMLATPNQPPPPLPPKISTELPTRQTETFRLVRSPSANVLSNEKIVAGGEHWQVIGAEKKKKGSSSSKEQIPKEPESRSYERYHRDRDSKDRRDAKEYEFRDRDYRRGTKVRDSKDGDHVRDSRDREYHRDSKDREHARDSRDRVYVRDSREYSRGYRDKDHRESRYKDHHDSRDKDPHRKSRDRYYGHDSRDRCYDHDSRDRDHVHDSKDWGHVRHSRDRNYSRELRDQDRDYAHDHKIRESKDRSQKDREPSTQFEKKRDGKARAEPEPEADSRHRHRSRRDSKLGEGERSTTVPKVTSSRVLESDSRRHIPKQHDSMRSDRPQEDKSTRKRHEASQTTVNLSTAQSLPRSPTQDISTSRPLGRHPSLSARPTSQLPPADEINAMRAKEAWDMERLWRARSMQGDELNGYATIPSNHNTPVMASISPPFTGLYGSSHTAFVQQAPSQPQYSIYHSMPAAPPPIIYSSQSSSIPTIAHQAPPTSHRQPRTRIYAESAASDQKSYTSARITNPLPELPRESPYEIPADARNSEFWTKYAGLAITH
ncbi:hypothetical protein C0995_004256 [Termitomyces sp. Mi166|nr:hypothetical protein C0995_004256 [Termitomyces sp. Mi166\